MNQHTTGWTDEQRELAARMWNDNRSALEIGEAIGKTRNAVIGFVWRYREKYGLKTKVTRSVEPRKQFSRTGLLQSTDTGKVRPGESRHVGARRSTKRKPPAPAPINVRDCPDNQMSPTQGYRSPTAASFEDITNERFDIKTAQMQGPCKWPIHDPGTVEFHYCGADRWQGSPYCEQHYHRSYAPRRP